MLAARKETGQPQRAQRTQRKGVGIRSPLCALRTLCGLNSGFAAVPAGVGWADEALDAVHQARVREVDQERSLQPGAAQVGEDLRGRILVEVADALDLHHHRILDE